MLSEAVFTRNADNAVGRYENLRMLAHEIGHIWFDFGNPVGRSKWVNEGLAEHFALKYITDNCSPTYFYRYLKQFQAEYRGWKKVKPIHNIGSTDKGYYNQSSRSKPLRFRQSRDSAKRNKNCQVSPFTSRTPRFDLLNYSTCRFRLLRNTDLRDKDDNQSDSLRPNWLIGSEIKVP